MKTKMPRVFFTYYAMPGVSLFLKVECALKKVGGKGNSADCYGGGGGGVVASGGRFTILAQEYCAKRTD